jgi:hypothetical protein
MENGKRKREQIDTDTPTTILTQIGIASCLPKIARNETLAKDSTNNGYCKSHKAKTAKN